MPRGRKKKVKDIIVEEEIVSPIDESNKELKLMSEPVEKGPINVPIMTSPEGMLEILKKNEFSPKDIINKLNLHEKNINDLGAILKLFIDKINILEETVKKLSENLNSNIDNINKNMVFFNKNINLLNLFGEKLDKKFNEKESSFNDRIEGLETNIKSNINDFKTIDENINILKEAIEELKEDKDNGFEDISKSSNVPLNTLKNLIDDFKLIIDLKQSNKI